MKKLGTIAALVGGAALSSGLAFAQGAPKVALDIEEARQIALKQVPGDITEEELEQEKGRWVYSFDIRPSSGPEMEVEIDANTGEVLEVEED